MSKEKKKRVIEEPLNFQAQVSTPLSSVEGRVSLSVRPRGKGVGRDLCDGSSRPDSDLLLASINALAIWKKHCTRFLCCGFISFSPGVDWNRRSLSLVEKWQALYMLLVTLRSNTPSI